MNSELSYIAAGLLGYFLGAIPFAVLVARSHGVNILQEGSGNPGATNVKRVLGKRAGNQVFLLDFTKGVAAVVLPQLIFWQCSAWLGSVGLTAAVMGHSFSIFLKFKGGKGVATTMGGLLALIPVTLLIGVLVWLLLFYTTRYVSLASLGFGVSLPVAGAVQLGWRGEQAELNIWGVLVLVFVAVLLVYRHRSNVSRLLAGTENRFEKK